jgi:heme/copper-type cytochrome/quinol oxidase subunit 2
MKIPTTKQLTNLKANKSLWLIVIIVILIVAAIPAYYYYNQYKSVQTLLQNPGASADATVQDLVNKVGKLMELPTNEIPKIATVSDITKLKGQAFFANAQNGDKVLVYSQNKEAILYRESINKIIQVAPVDLGAVAPTPMAVPSSAVVVNPTPAPTVTPMPAVVTVAVYNGTTISGLANKAGGKITQAMTNATITAKGDTKNNYAKTEVIDLSGKQGPVAVQIAKLLGGSVAMAVPDGETKPNADIFVILGTDFAK